MAVKIYQKTDRIQLSENFNSREFRCGLGRPCSCHTTLIDDLLVLYLQKIRDYFGVEVTITSAYRCPSYNSSVGGATGSYHTRGQAADIVVVGVTPRRVAAYAEYIGVKGIGLYETAADGYFVHIDTRTTKSFWYGQSQAYRSTFGGAAAMGPGGGTSSTGAASDGDYSLQQFVRDVQAACGAAVDGVAGPETLGKTVTLSASKNISHAAVLPAQWRFVWSTDPAKALPFIALSTSYYNKGDCCLNAAGQPRRSKIDVNTFDPDISPEYWEDPYEGVTA